MRRSISRTGRPFEIVFACTVLSAAVAGAQQSPASARRTALLEDAVARHWYIRAVTLDSAMAEGLARSINDRTVTIHESSFAIHRIAVLERRVRAGGTAVPMAAVGGAFYGVIAQQLLDIDDLRGSNGIAIAGAALFGVVLGFVLGDAMNPGEYKWRHLWP